MGWCNANAVEFCTKWHVLYLFLQLERLGNMHPALEISLQASKQLQVRDKMKELFQPEPGRACHLLLGEMPCVQKWDSCNVHYSFRHCCFEPGEHLVISQGSHSHATFASLPFQRITSDDVQMWITSGDLEKAAISILNAVSCDEETLVPTLCWIFPLLTNCQTLHHRTIL